MEKFFEFNTGKIHYSDQGRGETVVLIHGYLETSEIWNSFAQKLAQNFRIITIDLPGHGKSDACGEVYTMEFMATIIKELIKSLNIEHFFLTGHSLGGYVTLAFADLFPEVLSGFCLFHSHPFADSVENLEKRKEQIKIVKAGNKNLMIPNIISNLYAFVNLQKFSKAIEKSKNIAFSVKGETITAVLRSMMTRTSRLSVLEEGKVPCLWILGTMDNLINFEQIQTKVRLPANANMVILKESGHMGFIEEEDKSVKIITEFVRKCS
jgi:pimeloyl-ACP methyl ester carboxylesterase